MDGTYVNANDTSVAPFGTCASVDKLFDDTIMNNFINLFGNDWITMDDVIEPIIRVNDINDSTPISTITNLQNMCEKKPINRTLNVEKSPTMYNANKKKRKQTISKKSHKRKYSKNSNKKKPMIKRRPINEKRINK